MTSVISVGISLGFSQLFHKTGLLEIADTIGMEHMYIHKFLFSWIMMYVFFDSHFCTMANAVLLLGYSEQTELCG